jgi:hypothetical protein
MTHYHKMPNLANASLTINLSEIYAYICGLRILCSSESEAIQQSSRETQSFLAQLPFKPLMMTKLNFLKNFFQLYSSLL